MDERFFIKGQTAYCRKPFRFSGKDFVRGEVFPYRKRAVSERKVRQMFDAGMITHTNLGQTQTQVKKYGEVEIKSMGGGWYEVYCEGEKVSGSKSVRKDEAEEIAASYMEE